MTKYGDYSTLTKNGLVYSSSKRRKTIGTYRFWSPLACRAYYIKSYPKDHKDRGVLVSNVHDKGQGTGLRRCTWDAAITWVQAKNDRYEGKVRELQIRSPTKKIGDEIIRVDLFDLYPDVYDHEDACRTIGDEIAGYLELLLSRMPELTVDPYYSEDEDVLAQLRKGDESGVTLQGSQKEAALLFLKATYPKIEHNTCYRVPGQQSHHAVWEWTHRDPSTWEKDGVG